MARGKFKRFPVLPIEIRFMIWRLAARERRIIRAESESRAGAGDHFKQVYHLSAGPVPKVLHINRESRKIGLQHYTAVRSHAALNTNSEKWFTAKNEYRVYINFDVDTIYFVSLAPAFNTLSWLRRIPKEEKKVVKGDDKKEVKKYSGHNTGGVYDQATKQKMIPAATNENSNARSIFGGQITSAAENKITNQWYINIGGPREVPFAKPIKKIKHIALSSKLITAADATARRLDFLYGMGTQLPFLKSITIIVDNSGFHSSKFPHTYALKQLPPPLLDYPRPDPEKMTQEDFLKQSQVGRMVLMLRTFWSDSQIMGADNKGSLAKKYRDFLASEQGKNWAKPKFKVLGIYTDKKKSKAGY